MKATLKTIAWDIDDVLNDLTEAWFEHAWKREHATSLRFDELTENPPHRILGVPLAEYLASLDAFRASAFESLPVRPDVLQWFEKYGAAFRHVALTATPFASAPLSAAWVLRNLGRWIRVVGFIPSPRPNDLPPKYDETKGAFLEWWGKSDYFVDDRPDNCADAQAAGITTFLAPRPWNDATENPLTKLAAVSGAHA